jgi:hypothetical protein
LTIYLDYNASAPLKPSVKAAIMTALDSVGNPASVHQAGRRARAHLETAREEIARLVAVKPAQVILTSGGTEANNLAILPWSGTVLYSATEHDSVRAAINENAIIVPVDGNGLIDLAALEQLLKTAKPPILLSVMLVNFRRTAGLIEIFPHFLHERYGCLYFFKFLVVQTEPIASTLHRIAQIVISLDEGGELLGRVNPLRHAADSEAVGVERALHGRELALQFRLVDIDTALQTKACKMVNAAHRLDSAAVIAK